MRQSLIIAGSGNEWLEFISCLGFTDLDNARALFYSGDYARLSDLGQKAIYTAGRGKALSLEGNLPGSKLSFDEALRLAEDRNAEAGYPVHDEVLAYVNYEMAGFLSKYGESFTGLGLYRAARRLVESQKLSKIIDYQLFAFDLERGRASGDAEVRHWFDYFAENDMEIMQMIAMRRYSSYLRSKKEYTGALEWIDCALKLAYEYDYLFMVEQFKNAKGYILLMMARYGEARSILNTLVPEAQSRFLRSVIFENLSLSHDYVGEYEATAEYMDKAIHNSQKYSVLSLVPDECLYMGELQRDRFQRPELATHYFGIGYEAALNLAEYGFALKGDRLKVVQAFENRSKTGYSLPEPHTKSVSPFALFLGRNWREILDLFHFSLLKNHLKLVDGSADLPERLGLKASTYYAIKRRLTAVGYSFKPTDEGVPVKVNSEEYKAFNIYVSKLQDLDWTTANTQFEGEVIEFLFKHAGYQKTKLAEELNISYPTVLQKTRSLTQTE